MPRACRQIISLTEVLTSPRTLNIRVFSMMLSHSAEDASQSLRIQLETADRVLELTRDVGIMAETAKEAFKVSNQVSEILRLVTEHTVTLQMVQSISHGVNTLTARSQGMSPSTSRRQKRFLTSCSRIQKVKKRRSCRGSPLTSTPVYIMISAQGGWQERVIGFWSTKNSMSG